MELQIEAQNITMRNTWQEKIEQEKEKLVRHHAGLLHHLRVTIEGTMHHKEGGYEVRLVATIPNDTVVVKRKGEDCRALIVDAFNVLNLQLKEEQRKKKNHA